MKKYQPTQTQPGQDKRLPRLSLFTFDHSRTFAIIWLCLTVFGVLSYTTFLKRQGFPSINIPFSVISGTYFVNDPQKVDSQLTGPVSDLVLKDKRVSTVLATARGTFYTVVIQYKEGTNALQAGQQLDAQIKAAHILPKSATLAFTTPKFGFTERGDDAVVSLYATDGNKGTEAMAAQGRDLATFLKAQHLTTIKDVSLINPFVEGFDPLSGKAAVTQTLFDRYGVREGQQNKFFDSVAVGVAQQSGADVIKMDTELRAAVDKYNHEQTGKSTYRAAVSAGYAPGIKQQISELQGALLEGLTAVLVVGSIVIAIRASILTVLSMLTVLAITIGLLLVIGYTLNTITLFSLILCLALIVDDTIIMTEAIDAQRRRRKDPRETIHVATGKISRAMVAATSTAILSFTPLLFVGGILGSFIRAIPITVISSLLISLCVALIFIPVFARMLILRKKQMGAENVHEPAARVEAKIAHFISRPMLWARRSHKKLLGVGLVAVVVGFAFVGAAGFLFQKVTFNIFPPSKDTNGLIVQLSFPNGTTIKDAQALSREADDVVAKKLGSNLVQASYYATGKAQSASLFIEIIPYNKRDVRSPQLVTQLQDAYKDFHGAAVAVSQQDVGPPSSPFMVRIESPNRDAAFRLAEDVQSYLQGRQLTRLSGEKATIETATISDPNTFTRTDGKSFIEVTATFDAKDTSTLVTLAKSAVEKAYPPDKVASFGLSKDALQFDFGQESENQDSFKTLALAFPIVLLAIYVLLALQFRSLAQPLMIFTAIPFSLFGITLGLYLTKNAFSFFAMLGFFALIGLSLKNTILLTDYANQQRRLGMPAVDAAVEALGERFRPLIATSLTAVVSLIPLAIMSPFWEGLAVVLICGLLSSTLLVILVFPYYYLGVEFVRLRISRRAGLTWLGLSIVATALASWRAGFKPIFILLFPAIVAIIMWQFAKRRRSRR